MKVTEKKGNTKRTVVIILTVIIGLLVILLACFGAWNLFSGGTNIFNKLDNNNSDAESAVSSEEESTETTVPNVSSPYDYVDMDYAQISQGELILVNNLYEYTGNSDDVINVYENKSQNYSVSTYELMARKTVIDNFNALIDAFYTATNIDNINVISGYRTREVQQSLYDAGDPLYVARPGFSEHETGYALDLDIWNGEYSEDFTGEGDYAWINQNCYKYGFILRYTEEKKDITSINAETWHYRYVGVPHSYYMAQNNLCLEEYIQLLNSYMFDGEHLNIDCDGQQYEVYFVTATPNGVTSVPVPKGSEYTISGNNVNGFVVTVKK